VDGLRCRRVVRRDVPVTTAPTQRAVRAFVDFEAPNEMAYVLLVTLAAALEKESGSQADSAGSSP
jgi:hypothetical protein